MKKAQASFELLMILGFSLSFTLVAGGYFLMYSNEASLIFDSNQLDNVFLDVMEKSNRVFFAGNGNRITIDAALPEGIENISIHQSITGSSATNPNIPFSYINVTVRRGGGFTSQLYYPDNVFVLLNCSISCTQVGDVSFFNQEHLNRGPKRIRVESRGDFVDINFINQ